MVCYDYTNSVWLTTCFALCVCVLRFRKQSQKDPRFLFLSHLMGFENPFRQSSFSSHNRQLGISAFWHKQQHTELVQLDACQAILPLH